MSRRTRTSYAARGIVGTALVLGTATPLVTAAAREPVSAPTSTPAVTSAGQPKVAGLTLPGRIGAPPGVKQMITVTSKAWSTQGAMLRAWQRGTGGRWHRARGPVRVMIGYNGWVRGDLRKQSTGTTPAGRYRLPFAFGRLADPGSHVPYRRFDRTDWWPYEPRDPATYNVWQWHKAPGTHWRANKSEHLWDYYDQYAYGIVIGFNLPRAVRYSQQRHQWVADERADTKRGGGIFLHVRDDGPTAGCVSMSRPQMRWLIRWLRPKAHPRIVMGPDRYVVRR
jgi:L,D-peptidoglycan transpeptidase YkuD (ErfK/YbiS/YcfS/YnhG family)